METSRPIATAEMQRQITSEAYAQDCGTYRCTLTLRDGTQIAGHRSYGPGAAVNAAFASGLSRLSALRNLHEQQTQHA